MVRGAFSTTCVEIDLVVKGRNKIVVAHPPVEETGFELEHVFDVLRNKRSHLWLDVKNIDTPKNCFLLLDYLKQKDWDMGSLLIEFPSNSDFGDTQLSSCSSQIQDLEIHTSYYVETEQLLECTEKLKAGDTENEVCEQLSEKLNAVIASEGVTGLSFDYNGALAMESVEFENSVKWHTWHITMEQLSNLDLNAYGFITPYNEDPNNY